MDFDSPQALTAHAAIRETIVRVAIPYWSSYQRASATKNAYVGGPSTTSTPVMNGNRFARYWYLAEIRYFSTSAFLGATGLRVESPNLGKHPLLRLLCLFYGLLKLPHEIV